MEVIQFADHISIRLISELISGTSVITEKLLEYTNGTATSSKFTIPTLPVLFVNLDLKLYGSESVISSPVISPPSLPFYLYYIFILIYL